MSLIYAICIHMNQGADPAFWIHKESALGRGYNLGGRVAPRHLQHSISNAGKARRGTASVQHTSQAPRGVVPPGAACQ